MYTLLVVLLKDGDFFKEVCRQKSFDPRNDVQLCWQTTASLSSLLSTEFLTLVSSRLQQESCNQSFWSSKEQRLTCEAVPLPMIGA